MKKLFLSILLIVFITACESQQSNIPLPQKPSSVPESALWVGGLDGGVFVLVRKHENSRSSEYWGEIYYVSGDLAYKGKMETSPKGTSDIDYMNPESYQGWDGDTLYFDGNKQLRVQE